MNSINTFESFQELSNSEIMELNGGFVFTTLMVIKVVASVKKIGAAATAKKVTGISVATGKNVATGVAADMATVAGIAYAIRG